MVDDPTASRRQGMFALSRLSPALIRDVMSDDMLSRLNITAQRSLELSNNTSVDLDMFNAAVSRVLASEPVRLSIQAAGNSVECDVTVEDDGTVVLKGPTQVWQVGQAALLSMDAGRRALAIAHILATHTLHSSNRLKLIRAAEKETLTRDELMETLACINSSPESYLQQLAPRFHRGQLTVMDLLPAETSYWENIAAASFEGQSMSDFIRGDLERERIARFAEDIERGFRSISYTFVAPELVPLEWLRTREVNLILKGLEGIAANTNDPFAVAGAFEICADAIDRDDRFVALGEILLENLCDSPERLVARCQFFSAVFVLASARLAINSETQPKPAYWRRLAAAAHAGWVMQACDTSGKNSDKLFKWAMRAQGKEYVLSGYRDMREQPRWQPEWMCADFLAPDVVGRAYAATLRLAQVPASWSERITKMTKWLHDKKWEARMYLPAVLQGALVTDISTLNEQITKEMRSAFDEFAATPSVIGLLQLTVWVEVFGFGAQAIRGVKEVLRQLRTGVAEGKEDQRAAALSLATRIAVLNGDTDLAQAVADTYVVKFTSLQSKTSARDLSFELVKCAAAERDLQKGIDFLANRLTPISVAVSAGRASRDLLEVLEILRRVDGQLAPRLARAIHAARAAAPPYEAQFAAAKVSTREYMRRHREALNELSKR